MRGRHQGETREVLLAVAFLAFWILVPFRRIATLEAVNVQNDIYASDLLNDRLPARAFLGASLRRGELPLWMPGIYTGFPALAQVETGSLYPTNLLLFGLLPPWAAIAWAQILPLLLAGAGVFLLAREYDLALPAALLGAGSFALSGFLVAHLRQLNLVDAAAWVPFLFLATERLVRAPRGRAPLALAVCWALQCLAGHPQLTYFTGLVLAPWLVVRWRQVDGRRDPSRLPPRGEAWGRRFLRDPAPWRFASAILFGTLVAGAVLVPGFELAEASQRRGGFSWEESSAYPASPAAIATFFAPYLRGDPGLATYHGAGIFWEEYGYLGLLPAMLALLAIAARWRDGRVRLLAAVAVLAWLMTLGSSTPLFRLAWSVVPGMRYFRFPTRFLVFVELSLALLSAFGLAVLLDRLRSRKARGALATIVLAATAADLWVHQMRQVPQAPFAEWTAPLATVEFLDRQRAGEPWRHYALDAAAAHIDAYRRAGGWEGDLSPYLRLRALLQPSSNVLHGIESPDGYTNLVPRIYEEVWGSDKLPGIVSPSGALENGAWRVRPELVSLLRLFNVRYLSSVLPLAGEALRPAFESPEGIGVYEVAEPLPRAFVVGRATPVATDEEALARLRSGSFENGEEALVDDPVALPTDAASSRNVRMVSRGNQRLVLALTIAKPGFLVVSEGWHPGWRATVDGREVPIVRTNVMMRGVVVPAGDHRVDFRFSPPSVRWGALLSVAGLAGLMLLALGIPRATR